MQKAASRGKKRPHYGKRPNARPPYDIEQIAVALHQLYDRIAAEPLPRRLVTLLNRLKARH